VHEHGTARHGTAKQSKTRCGLRACRQAGLIGALSTLSTPFTAVEKAIWRVSGRRLAKQIVQISSYNRLNNVRFAWLYSPFVSNE
jgi:hypothetical protein